MTWSHLIKLYIDQFLHLILQLLNIDFTPLQLIFQIYNFLTCFIYLQLVDIKSCTHFLIRCHHLFLCGCQLVFNLPHIHLCIVIIRINYWSQFVNVPSQMLVLFIQHCFLLRCIRWDNNIWHHETFKNIIS